jgi:hypothetical protein
MPADTAPELPAGLSKGHPNYARTYTLLTKYYLGVLFVSRHAPPSERLPVSLRANGILLNNFRPIWVIQPSAQKYSAFLPSQISGFFCAVPSRQEGRIAIVTNARRDVVDAAASARKVDAGRGKLVSGSRRARRTALKRTAKPCGPGIRG